MTESLVVSIGRNRGNVPMPEDEWQRFAEDVVRIIRNNTESIYFAGFGSGSYQGMGEESFTVIASYDARTGISAIRVSLSYMCDVYGQEAIAVSQGEPQFVSPTRITERPKLKLRR